ncbi:MAG: PqiC family protein [Deferrisomatales bacterium]
MGPVTVARYLDRPNLITRGSDGEVVLDPFRRWAEPLNAQLARVLRRNLATLLGTDAVLGYPWRAAGSLDYQVTVEVERFDLDGRGTVRLDALWTLSAGERAAHPVTRRIQCEEQAEATAEEHTVAAHSRAALCLSREIAADVRARALAGSP